MTTLSPDMQIQGSRDLTTIDQVVSHPQWIMPPGMYDWLPLMIAEVATAKTGEGKDAKYKFSTRARQKAQALLMKLHDQNLKAAPPPQTLNVHVAKDVETAMGKVRQLPPDQRKALAAAHSIVSQLATEQPPPN